MCRETAVLAVVGGVVRSQQNDRNPRATASRASSCRTARPGHAGPRPPGEGKQGGNLVYNFPDWSFLTNCIGLPGLGLGSTGLKP